MRQIKGFDKKYMKTMIPCFFYKEIVWDGAIRGYKPVLRTKILNTELEDIYRDNDYDNKYLYILEPSPSETDMVDPVRFAHDNANHWAAILNNHYKRSFDRGEMTPFDFLFYAVRRHLNIVALKNILQSGSEQGRQFFFNTIRYLGICLPIKTQQYLQNLFAAFNLQYTVQTLPFIENSNYKLLIDDKTNPDKLDIFQKVEILENYSCPRPDNQFQEILAWSKDISINLQSDYKPLVDFFCFFSRHFQNRLIRRYFYDVKQGRTNLSIDLLNQLANNPYKHFDRFRQCLYKSKPLVDISTELICDCIKTFISNKGSKLQDINGIVDLSLSQCDHSNPKVDFPGFEMQWLTFCNGGLLRNDNFKGFVCIQIEYEIDPDKFQPNNLEYTLEGILEQCDRQFSIEQVVHEDNSTPLKKRWIENRRIYRDEWKVYYNRQLVMLNFFLKEEKNLFDENNHSSPSQERQFYVMTPELFDLSLVQNKVKAAIGNKYIVNYKTSEDCLIRSFLKPKSIYLSYNKDSQLGYDFGVNVQDVITSMLDNTSELTKIAEGKYYAPYSGNLLQNIMYTTFYNGMSVNSLEDDYLFIIDGSVTRYQHKNKKTGRMICRPKQEIETHPIIKEKPLWCQGDVCFHSCIKNHAKENNEWEEYKLLDLLQITGFEVIEETTAGIIPCEEYNQFVTQLRRAEKLWDRLTCTECGHVLFPIEHNSAMGIYSLFACNNPGYCSTSGKRIYLSFCYNCKTGIIDDRIGARCSNGLVICPTCLHCCSNSLFDKSAQRYLSSNRDIPPKIQKCLGKGHQGHGKNIYFCPDCGQQLTYIEDQERPDYSGNICPSCHKNFGNLNTPRYKRYY